ncbi:hypothetical protein [Burkholderia pyrrocinia]|nr:hypothetical protein [Burkholderia pyrrocinia]
MDKALGKQFIFDIFRAAVMLELLAHLRTVVDDIRSNGAALRA